ncbi:MAG: hypothetical protein EPO40_36080 [Myxococcaceae bacterium]|nr:MAG: hypothetical protein EPO40_36080 [Myxococcaceae bacterium]
MVLVVSSLGLAACSQRRPAPPDPPTSQLAPVAPPTPVARPTPVAPAHVGHAANEAPGIPMAAPPGGAAEAQAHGADEHGGREHGGHEHTHGSPHGGIVMSVPGGHVEARLDPSGRITVWLLDEREQTVGAQGSSGRARLAVAGATDAPLAFNAQLNALVGQVPAPSRDHVVCLVTVTRPGGQPTNVRFSFHLEVGGH